MKTKPERARNRQGRDRKVAQTVCQSGHPGEFIHFSRSFSLLCHSRFPAGDGCGLILTGRIFSFAKNTRNVHTSSGYTMATSSRAVAITAVWFRWWQQPADPAKRSCCHLAVIRECAICRLTNIHSTPRAEPGVGERPGPSDKKSRFCSGRCGDSARARRSPSCHPDECEVVWVVPLSISGTRCSAPGRLVTQDMASATPLFAPSMCLSLLRGLRDQPIRTIGALHSGVQPHRPARHPFGSLIGIIRAVRCLSTYLPGFAKASQFLPNNDRF